MANNQTPCVNVKVIAGYDYIYNVIDYITWDHVINYNRLWLVQPWYTYYYIIYIFTLYTQTDFYYIHLHFITIVLHLKANVTNRYI